MNAKRLWTMQRRGGARDAIEYLVSANDDDAETIERFSGERCDPDIRLVTGPFKGSAPAWNEAARRSTGELLVQVSDDFVPPLNWDLRLIDAIITRGGGLDWPKKPIVVRVSDGFRDDGLMTMAVCNRAYYNLDGYFLMPAFRSVFSDDLFSYKAYKRVRDGAAIMVDARDIVFRHEHHYHCPDTVPLDATYRRQNSAEAYSEGERLFDALCPDWRESGLVTWRK